MKKFFLRFLRDVTLTRWQVGLFKLCVFSGGILFTIYLHDFFAAVERLRWILAIIPGVYISYIYFSPKKRKRFLKAKAE